VLALRGPAQPQTTLKQACRVTPDAHQPSGRKEDDGEKDCPDHRVEAVANELDPPQPVVQDGKDDRADPGALEPVEPADDGDDQYVDGLRKRNRARRDAGVPPDGEDPGERGHERAEPERERAQEQDVVAERAHARGVVADSLDREPERRAHDVAKEEIDGRGDAERDVKEPGRFLERIPDDVRALDAVHPAEARELSHLSEEEVDEDGECERDHEEVDPMAAACDRPEEETDHGRRHNREERGDPGIQGHVGASVSRGEVGHREPCDPVKSDLAQGHHPRVPGEEDQADGRDAEPERLRDDSAQVEVAEEERAECEDGEGGHARPPAKGPHECHAGLPKSPSGRTASTSTRSPKMRSTE
jgi:hypothetical protein